MKRFVNCPICNTMLELDPSEDLFCINNCYSHMLYYSSISGTFKEIFRVFNSKHFSYKSNDSVEYKKSIDNKILELIEYWKENDRYLVELIANE